MKLGMKSNENFQVLKWYLERMPEELQLEAGEVAEEPVQYSLYLIHCS